MHRLFLVSLLGLSLLGHAAAASEGVREVQYDDRSVISIQARLRVTTTIVLPDEEAIVDYICGDRDFWVINGDRNVAHVKAARAGGWTNLNLVASSGRIYSFRLQEGSDSPDFKVFVTLPAGVSDAQPKKYYTLQDLEAVRAKLADAEQAAVTAQQRATESVAAFRADYPTRLRFDYEYSRGKAPFSVSAVWHDGQSTFVRSTASELPVLYELKDGQPAVVQYQVRDGSTYVVHKILERGYLMLGKEKLHFRLVNH